MATPAPKKARRLGALVAAMMMGTALVGVLAPTASAQDDTTSDTAAADGHRRPQLTDEQQQCLQDQGIEKPATDENGNRVEPTDEQRAAFRAAAEACDIDLPLGHGRPQLTDEQKQCLEDQGVEKPARDENGERTEPTDEQRAAFRAAAEACGIDLPDAPPSDSSGS